MGRYDYEEYDYNYDSDDIEEIEMNSDDDDQFEYETLSDDHYWDNYYHNLTDEISDD